MIIWELFWTFFKIGAFTFGGGYAMLSLIMEEVERHGWMTREELVNFTAVSESTPGPFAVNISTYVGAEIAGIPGAVCATLGVVLPSFCMILLVAKCYDAYRKNTVVAGCMLGLRPAVVGMIATAVLSVGESALFPSGVSAGAFAEPALYASLGIFALAMLLSQKKLHPIWIILLSAALGILLGYAGVWQS